MNALSEVPANITLADGWYLESYDAEGKVWLVRIDRFPFTIGRREDCDLCLPVPEMSRDHAHIERGDHDTLIVYDHSANGTFVNSERISQLKVVTHNDIVRFSKQEFRVFYKKTASQVCTELTDERDCLTRVSSLSATGDTSLGLFSSEKRLEKLLQARAVKPYFQPLIHCRRTGERLHFALYGFELLGRGAFTGLPENPGALFALIEKVEEIKRRRDLAPALSALFCETGIEHAAQHGPGLRLFFNTVANETDYEYLRQYLPRLKALAPDLALTMEVHETAAIKDIATMRNIRALLHALDIQLAYDDFGAGQARLLELIEVPPDVLKFDLKLIRHIDQRPPEQQHAIAKLVAFAREQGVATLAEGTETRAEVAVCVKLGFDYLQGYYFGRPAPVITTAVPPTTSDS